MSADLNIITDNSSEREKNCVRDSISHFMVTTHPKATENNYEIFKGLYEQFDKLKLSVPADMARQFLNEWFASQGAPASAV